MRPFVVDAGGSRSSSTGAKSPSDSKEIIGHGLYRLSAVVTHLGSAAGGHYVTFRRNILSSCRPHAGSALPHMKNDWVLADDSCVSPVSLQQVLRTEPYLLIYEKAEPTIEKQYSEVATIANATKDLFESTLKNDKSRLRNPGHPSWNLNGERSSVTKSSTNSSSTTTTRQAATASDGAFIRPPKPLSRPPPAPPVRAPPPVITKHLVKKMDEQEREVVHAEDCAHANKPGKKHSANCGCMRRDRSNSRVVKERCKTFEELERMYNSKNSQSESSTPETDKSGGNAAKVSERSRSATAEIMRSRGRSNSGVRQLSALFEVHILLNSFIHFYVSLFNNFPSTIFRHVFTF